MTWINRLTGWIARDHTMRKRGELDAPTDPSHGTRATGGVPKDDTMDQNSTTGTTPSEEFVGRAGSDETGDVGISGAEARAGRRADGRSLDADDV